MANNCDSWDGTLHGLEGLYVFINHPARVKVLCHEDVFDRLMRESYREVTTSASEACKTRKEQKEGHMDQSRTVIYESQCKCGNVLFFRSPRLNCLKCGLPIPYYRDAVRKKTVRISIKDLRTITGLSKMALAKKLHITTGRLQRLEVTNAMILFF